MKHWLCQATGNYYWGDRISVAHIEVPARPSEYHVWQGGAWMLDGDLLAQGEQRRFTAIIQQQMDAVAQQRNYDGILSLCSYATSSDATFAAEGQAGIEWRDAVWKLGYQLLDEVKSGEREIPTDDELIAILPPMEWPAA